ncbi:MAG: NAD(P)/FAD-dependent oxidoreductase [Bacteroidales bacterium]|nr:NAD(P)/FAD-dependent oxidoreductase [Bacteroidales bacterium]
MTKNEKRKPMYDIIVIGAGLGGLTAGAKLAKSGKKVLLIEQHDRAGGCATTFKKKGFTLEVGLHEMDGLHPRDMKMKIFRDLGILDTVEFVKVPAFYRFRNERKDIVVSHDPNEMAEKLTILFPDEKQGIKTYFYQVMNIRQIMKQKELNPDMTVGKFLDSIISDEDLKLILLGNLGYFHDDPYGLSWGYYCMAQNSYYTGGGNFIKGGSQMLSNALADVITDNGGEVLLNHKVTGILVESGLAVGVKYEKKKGGEPLQAKAKDIIANASIPQVANNLLPKKYQSFRSQFSKLSPGASLLTVYFGFSRSPKSLGHTDYSTFVYDPSVKNQADIFSNNTGSFKTRSYSFVDYSQIDSGLAAEGKAVGAIVCMDYTDDWDNLDKQAYKTRKKEVERIFIDRLNKLIPGIEDLIEYCEVGTAKTVQGFTMNPKGSVYGFAQTTDRAKTNIESPLENLHFASAWTQTGGGFSGAIFSGYLCAIGVIRKNR